MMDLSPIKCGVSCKCPRCGVGDLYRSSLSLTLNDTCAECALNLEKNDSADGPAVFMMFILGFALVPLALWLDHIFMIPLVVHAILWTIVALGLTLGMLRPLKSYVIALQFKHRPGDWG